MLIERVGRVIVLNPSDWLTSVPVRTRYEFAVVEIEPEAPDYEPSFLANMSSTAPQCSVCHGDAVTVFCDENGMYEDRPCRNCNATGNGKPVIYAWEF